MDFDTSILAKIIDEVRRSHGMTAYCGTMSDYRKRQDAVDTVMAIAEDEQKDPCEVARVSYGRFLESKNAWLHNAGHPLGAWVQNIGHYWRPPKPIKEEKPKHDRAGVYRRDTKNFEDKQKRDIARYEREGGGVPDSMEDVVEKLKKKQLNNL